MSDPKMIRELLDKALEAAASEGMEFVADSEGCTWTGKELKVLTAEAEQAREALDTALASYFEQAKRNTDVLFKLRTCLSVCIGAGGSASATELRELVKACGLELEEVG